MHNSTKKSDSSLQIKSKHSLNIDTNNIQLKTKQLKWSTQEKFNLHSQDKIIIRSKQKIRLGNDKQYIEISPDKIEINAPFIHFK
jgi:hypothetical protein